MAGLTSQNVTGLILAGGRARRMQPVQGGGAPVDKALLRLVGKTLVEHAVGFLAPRVGSLLISANRNHDVYAKYGRVVADDPALGADLGPLAGVASALAVCNSPWLVVIPVDVPVLPTDLIDRLYDAVDHASVGDASVDDGMAVIRPEAGEDGLARVHAGLRSSRLAYATGQDGRAHPLCMLVHRDLHGSLQSYLRDGERKVQTWQECNHAKPVLFEGNERLFFNINTPEDLRRLDTFSES